MQGSWPDALPDTCKTCTVGMFVQMLLCTRLTQELCQTLCKTCTIGMFVQMLFHTILTQKLCQTLCKTHIVGKFVQIPLCTILTQEQEVILQLSRIHNKPWRCFGCYGKWCNIRGTVASKGSFLLVGLLTRRDWAVDEEGGWLYDKKGS